MLNEPRHPLSSKGEFVISYEFFPPKTPQMEAQLWETIKRLEPLHPRFVSVTYGAGGSTRERTHATVERIARETQHEAGGASDLRFRDARRGRRRHPRLLRTSACATSSPCAAIRRAASARASCRIRSAIRPPADLVAGSADRRFRDLCFDLSRKPSRERLHRRRHRCAEIARSTPARRRAITQFFFENDIYLRFLDRVRARGIDIPIVPGIMPVQNFKQTANFAASAGASVPRLARRALRWPRRRSGDAQADRGRRRRRTGHRPRRSRRDRLSFLHHEPRRSRLRDLPPARHAARAREKATA